MNKDGLWHIITFTLYNESQMAVETNLKEWNLFLQVKISSIFFVRGGFFKENIAKTNYKTIIFEIMLCFQLSVSAILI